MAEDSEPVIAGPYALYDGSFILEFLKPKPSRNASVLMRATYKHDHPMCKLGRGHSQSPPLHIHFRQYESFSVLSGSVGTTSTYTTIDTVHTPSTTGEASPHTMPPWTPHTFWPDPDAREDTTILLWAHPNPDDMEDKMDRLFFQNLLMYVSDVAEGKERLSILQVMLVQHASATAMIWFPTAWFLGPLRWWIPYQFQTICVAIARLWGMKPLMKKYVSDEEWEEVQQRIETAENGGVKRKLA
ncbi:hypothetical protein RBB50_004073 [Rhinocladiella similis]